MTREELKALGLSDEQIEKIVDDYGKNYVSKSQFNQKNEEAKHLKGEADTFKKEIEELKKTNKDNADLAAQIEKMKEDAKTREQTYKANTKKMQIDSLVDLALVKNKAKNSKAVKALLVDLDKAKIIDGAIKGLISIHASAKDAWIEYIVKICGYIIIFNKYLNKTILFKLFPLY